MFSMISRKMVGIAVGVIAAMATVVLVPQLFENQSASEIMVIQAPFSGKLSVYTEPGMKWQGLGKVTKYPRQSQYSFCSTVAKEGEMKGKLVRCEGVIADAKRLRFNDGGHANLNGAVNWEMPLDTKSVIEIHKKFGSSEGVESRAVSKMLDAAVYLAGPLMSSTESSGERRSELVQVINDQAENGVYVTHGRIDVIKDAITGVEKTTLVTDIVRGANGQPKRQQGSVLSEFNIKLLPLSISELAYDDIVEKQIAMRQKATTDVQIAQANARKSEQDALTVEAQGKAQAASAKWAQETIKAKEVTLAQQKLEVATLAAKEAEQYKREQILRGEGEGERKRLVMAADGALDPKLKAFIEVNKNYAAAMGSYTGSWVPQTVMGQGASSSNGAQAMIELLTAKTARDLGLDTTIAGRGATASKK